MANSSIDPNRRDDDLGEPPADDGAAAGGPGKLTAAGRSDLVDPDDPDRPLIAAGRDSLDPGDRGAATLEGIEDRTLASPEDDPIGPGGSEPAALHAEEGEEHGRSFAAKALMLLIFALVVFGISLALVPNVAPHLPAGIARHLMPGQVELDERLAALDQRIATGASGATDELAALRDEVAALSARIEGAEQAVSGAEASAADSAAAAERNATAGEAVARAEAAATEAAGLADTATAAAAEAGQVAAAANRDVAALARRMDAVEARLGELGDQVQAVADSLAEGAADGEAAGPELVAAFAQLRSEVEGFRQRMSEQPAYVTSSEAELFVTQDDLRTARSALTAEIEQAIQALPPAEALVVRDELEALREDARAAIASLQSRLEEVSGAASEAAKTAGAADEAASEAVAKVEDAIRDARLGAASAALTSRLVNGVPFGDALDEAAALSGSPPPDELAAVADDGVSTTAELLRTFGRPARDALEADIEERSGGGILGQASARVRSVIAGRPAGEQEGDTVEAALSRVEARLREGDAAAALAEAEGLPEPARDALGNWLEALRARVAAAEAAERWLAPSSNATQG